MTNEHGFGFTLTPPFENRKRWGSRFFLLLTIEKSGRKGGPAPQPPEACGRSIGLILVGGNRKFGWGKLRNQDRGKAGPSTSVGMTECLGKQVPPLRRTIRFADRSAPVGMTELTDWRHDCKSCPCRVVLFRGTRIRKDGLRRPFIFFSSETYSILTLSTWTESPLTWPVTAT